MHRINLGISGAPNLSATSRAIRLALATSATALALAGSGLATAACSYTDVATVTCTAGAYNLGLPDGAFVPVNDLTLVLDPGVTIATAVGVLGVDGNNLLWTGDVTIVSAADITTVGANGILAYGTNSAVSTYGDITTSGSAPALRAGAFNDVTVVNGGDILAYTTGGFQAAVSAGSSYGIISIDNQASATITDIGTAGYAHGVYAIAYFGETIINNDGAISASSTAQAAAVNAQAGYDTTVTNTGSISAASANSLSLGVFVYTGEDGTVYNSGSIVANASFLSWAVQVYASSGTASVTNSAAGNIDATSYSNDATGVDLHGYDATINNAGDISAAAYYSAVGVYASADNDAIVINSGSITANSSGYYGAPAYGIHAITTTGSASVTSSVSGTISATAYGRAYGINATTSGYDGNVTIDNAGSISASSVYANATGVLALTLGALGDIGLTLADTNVVNASSASGSVRGIDARTSGYDGNVTIDNAGSILATAYTQAIGVSAGAVGASADIGITLAATSVIDANSTAGTATGIFASSRGYDGNVTIDNAGSISASSLYGHALGVGVFTRGDFGDIAITLADTSVIYATSDAPYAQGISARARGLDGDVTIDNAGSISAIGHEYGTPPVATASGIQATASGDYGDIGITLADTSVIYAYTVSFDAVGIFAGTSGYDGNVTIDNAGSISAIATGYAYYASYSYYYGNAIGAWAQTGGDSGDIGITLADTSVIAVNSIDGRLVHAIRAVTSGLDGNVTIDNAGSISASSLSSNPIGVMALTGGDFSDISITLTDSSVVDVSSSTGLASGISASTLGYDGNVTIDNSGSITASALYSLAYGVLVRTYGDSGDIGITLADTSVISANSTAGYASAIYAVGISAKTIGFDADLTIDNAGSISATAYGGVFGVRVFATGASGDIDITLADISVIDANSTAGYANGIFASAFNSGGNVTVDNGGSISANAAYGVATGIRAKSLTGLVSVTNSATGSISALGEYFATGVAAIGYFGYGASVDNAGDIQASSTYNAADGIRAVVHYSGDSTVTNSGSIEAYSYSGFALGVFAAANYDDATIDNSGTIIALGDNQQAGGIQGISTYGSVNVTNSGNVQATSYSGSAFGIGANNIISGYYAGSQTGYATVTNAATGTIAVTGYAWATGIIAYSEYGTTVISSGSIGASATGDGGSARGIAARANSEVTVTNSGSITADGNRGLGIFANSGYGLVSVTNSATGSITATGAYTATGIFVSGYSGVSVDNAGDISATADGNAFGVYAYTAGPTGDILIHNSGDITASASTSGYMGVGVYLISDTVTTLYNSGTITADIAVLTASSSDTIYNSGTMTGAIVTGGGDDIFANQTGAVWNAIGSSDFGSGDDAIFNDGTINMTDASIDLGIDPAGNQFVNDGTITVSGNNIIDMGTGADLITPNPYPFYNNDVIDFQDGAPNDVLTIVGDFAGVGDINVDVSALNAASDLLYIDGSVVDGSVSTINVNMLDLPDSPVVEVPMVLVTGNSSPSNFVLGDVVYNPDNFVTLGFDLVSGTTAGQDSYSLRVAMDGLTDAGKLGAIISPGVQLLLRDQVGTWEQRSSGLPEVGQSKFSLWARVFHNHGVVRPESQASFGSDGGLAFDLDTSGGETGLNYAGSQRFNFGLILGHSELRQKLRDGIGNDTIKGNVYGGYGTMNLPGGFYLDLSHRRLKFDAVLDATTGQLRSGGEAETSNMESGFTWHFKDHHDLQVQFQQTRTRVTSIDSLSGGTVNFDADGGGSSVTRLAAELRKVYKPTASGTVWLSRVILHAVRESDGDSHYAIGNNATGQASLRGTSFRLEAGASAQRGSLLFFGSLVYENGGPLHNFVGAQLGARYVW